MKLIVCIDDNGGILFNHRRQSQDRVLRQRILQQLGKNDRLLLSPYTAKQFTEVDDRILVTETPLSTACTEDVYFLEDLDYSLEACQEVILYRWNRIYPFDTSFALPLESFGFQKCSTVDFEGFSHPKITEEVYIRR